MNYKIERSHQAKEERKQKHGPGESAEGAARFAALPYRFVHDPCKPQG